MTAVLSFNEVHTKFREKKVASEKRGTTDKAQKICNDKCYFQWDDNAKSIMELSGNADNYNDNGLIHRFLILAELVYDIDFKELKSVNESNPDINVFDHSITVHFQHRVWLKETFADWKSAQGIIVIATRDKEFHDGRYCYAHDYYQGLINLTENKVNEAFVNQPRNIIM